MKNIDIINHVKGESQFVDDISTPANILYASVVYSKIANGKILKLDTSNAKRIHGVKVVLTAAGIPGENQIGGIIEDEELLNEVNCLVEYPVAVMGHFDKNFLEFFS